MKNLKTIVFVTAPIITLIYLLINYSQWGIDSSISHYAIEWKENGLIIVPFIWLWLNLGLISVGSLLNVKKDPTAWLLFLSVMVLTCIGFWTGYNPDVFNNKLENMLHVVFVYVSIGLVLSYMIIRGYLLNHLIWSITLILSAIGLIIYVIKSGMDNHTYWIEVVMFAIIYLYLLIFNSKIMTKIKEEIEEEKEETPEQESSETTEVSRSIGTGGKRPPSPPTGG